MKLRMKNMGMMIMLGALTFSAVACSQAPVEEEKTPEVSEESTQTPEDEDTTSNDGVFPVTITDSNGEEVTVEKEPERIISLAPSTTEILYFLGEEENIVGRTQYCEYPESILDVPVVGGTADPNLETVLSLNPDLVLAATHTSQEVIGKLHELNIPVAFFDDKDTAADTYGTIELVGELVGEQAQAEIVIEDMKKNIAAIAESVQGIEDIPTVYYMMWYGDSDSTAGGDTFIGDLIRLAGGENIAEDVEGWSISKEILAEKDPEIIIVQHDKDITLEDRIKELQGMDFYKDLTAVKEGNIYEINADIISRQAPRLVDALDALVDIIHPDLEGTNE